MGGAAVGVGFHSHCCFWSDKKNRSRCHQTPFLGSKLYTKNAFAARVQPLQVLTALPQTPWYSQQAHQAVAEGSNDRRRALSLW